MGSKKLKIVIFSWRGPGHPNAGGAEIVTHEHAKAWAKAGHEVTLFTSFFQGAKEREIIDGVEIIRRGEGLIGVHLEAWKWYRSLDQKPDVVFDHFHGIPFFTPLYVKEKKIAFVHEVTKEVWFLSHLPFPKNWIVGLTGYLTEPLIFKLYRNIPFVTVSESTKEDLENWGIKKIYVIPNGIHKIKVDVSKEKSKTAIYLGALAKDKGIEDAIRAFALINKSSKNWQFWVVGRGDPRYIKKLKIQSSKLKIREKIKFWGYVSEKKKFEFLARAWVMINPSVREGWGLVNIEANSVGTPVVGYDVSGMRDSVQNGKTGILVPKDDYRSLAENAVKLVGNQKLYVRIQKEAINWAKRFDWKKAAGKSLRLIESL